MVLASGGRKEREHGREKEKGRRGKGRMRAVRYMVFNPLSGLRSRAGVGTLFCKGLNSKYFRLLGHLGSVATT